MPIAALSSSAPSAATGSGAAPTSAYNEQRFLKLLVTQLNNQDPLNPMENAELTSQLAQMSTVSGIEKMNAALQTLLSQGGASQVLQAATMIGRAVLVPGDALADGDEPTAFAVDLPSSAESVKANIVDGAGKVVRTLDLGALPGGMHSAVWDRTNEQGQRLPAGAYRVAVEATNGSNAVRGATTLVYDAVFSVSQAAGGVISLDLSGDRSVALSDVRMLR